MASLGSLSLLRDGCIAKFPPNTAKNLIDYWKPGPLRLFSPDDVPPQAFMESDRRTISDFVSISGKLAFSPEARAAAETLEPGVHQFFPVQILRMRGKRPIFRADGRLLETPYYLFNPGIRLDAVDLERSDVDIRTSPVATLVFPKPGRWDLVVLRRSVIAGHHIWKGGNQLGLYTFFSNDLTEIYRERKWRGLQLTPVAEA